MKSTKYIKKGDEMTFVDLFSGCGGLSLGFSKAGFKNLFAIEINKEASHTYKQNFPKHKLITKDIRHLSDKEIKLLVKDKKVDIVIGGPPCQGFSIAGSPGRNFIDDPRNNLFREFVRIVSIIKPKYFVMENVARMSTHNNGKTKNEIISSFKKIGYNADFNLINTVNYGIPQKRNRVIFIGNRFNLKNKFPIPKLSKKISVKEAIGDLPYLNSGETSNISNHEAMNHSDSMLKRMKYIQDGGNRIQIPLKIRPISGDSRKYIRYASDEPSFCVTGDMRKVFHYEQNRALTVRELARLQSFPDEFIFLGNRISQQQQVGDAVPPILAEAIANSILEMEKNV